MKLCKDCAHIDGEGDFALCKAPQIPQLINPITGKLTSKFCMVERTSGYCGSAAKWFVEKFSRENK